MLKCGNCGGRLERYASYDGDLGRSFHLYQCEDCQAEGGKAWGGDLPPETWGALEEPNAIADGGVLRR